MKSIALVAVMKNIIPIEWDVIACVPKMFFNFISLYFILFYYIFVLILQSMFLLGTSMERYYIKGSTWDSVEIYVNATFLSRLIRTGVIKVPAWNAFSYTRSSIIYMLYRVVVVILFPSFIYITQRGTLVILYYFLFIRTRK